MKEVCVTEQESLHDELHKLGVSELLARINEEDAKVAQATHDVIPQIEPLVNSIVDHLLAGGRLFYVGAGTSGRLGIVDASECPPTYGVDHGLVIGLIAGGDSAIRKAVEFAEDDYHGGWRDLKEQNVSKRDVVIGIAASGTTPYVVGALDHCRQNGIVTGSISCNPNSKVSAHADFPIECVVGPEFVTGSTRMKSGTAQKLILNMISTSVMIRIGRVEGNRMVDMQLSNNKLVERGTVMVMEELGCDRELAAKLLLEEGSVRLAVKRGSSSTEA